jgi:hypothetical protein
MKKLHYGVQLRASRRRRFRRAALPGRRRRLRGHSRRNPGRAGPRRPGVQYGPRSHQVRGVRGIQGQRRRASADRDGGERGELRARTAERRGVRRLRRRERQCLVAGTRTGAVLRRAVWRHSAPGRRPTGFRPDDRQGRPPTVERRSGCPSRTETRAGVVPAPPAGHRRSHRLDRTGRHGAAATGTTSPDTLLQAWLDRRRYPGNGAAPVEGAEQRLRQDSRRDHDDAAPKGRGSGPLPGHGLRSALEVGRSDDTRGVRRGRGRLPLSELVAAHPHLDRSLASPRWSSAAGPPTWSVATTPECWRVRG